MLEETAGGPGGCGREQDRDRLDGGPVIEGGGVSCVPVGGCLSPRMSDGDDIGGGFRLHDPPDRWLAHVGSHFTDGVLSDVAVRECRDIRGDEVRFELLASG